MLQCTDFLHFVYQDDGHVGSSHFLAIMNKHCSEHPCTGDCMDMFSVFLGLYLGVELLGCTLILF